MTTFQGLVYAIIQGITEFLPVGARAHQILLPNLLDWPEPTGAAAGALALGSFLAVLIYFRHDWASMISSFLQVVIYRKYPMTIDERLPFFISIAVLPIAGAWYYLHERIDSIFADPIWVAGSLCAFALILMMSDALGRKNKGMFDWNWLDSLLVGICQAGSLIPGVGLMGGALAGGMFRNYRRDSAAKFTFFILTPVLATKTFFELREVNFHAHMAMPDVSWLTFAVMVIVALFTGLLGIGGLMKHIQRKGFKAYNVYRLILGIGVIIWIKWRATSGA